MTEGFFPLIDSARLRMSPMPCLASRCRWTVRPFVPSGKLIPTRGPRRPKEISSSLCICSITDVLVPDTSLMPLMNVPFREARSSTQNASSWKVIRAWCPDTAVSSEASKRTAQSA